MANALNLQRNSKPPYQNTDENDALKGLIPPVSLSLDNELPIKVIKSGTFEMIRLDLVFKAGSWYQDRLLLSYFTRKILPEGTRKLNANQIAGVIDYFGASYEISGSYEFMIFSVLCLNKHLEKILNLLSEILFYPSFPEKEFQLLKDSKIKEILLDDKKVRMVAVKNFRNMLFGNKHPYGAYALKEDVNVLNTADVKSFYEKFINPGDFHVVLSGNVAEQEIKIINKVLGQHQVKKSPEIFKKNHIENPTKNRVQFFPVENAIQSAIRIGRPVMDMMHPDYPAMSVLNTLLGGYFGSRLMKNIREDKGYTYGINSSLLCEKGSVLFSIGSEVIKEFTKPALEEIYKEMNKLASELVQEEELARVKNYIFGKFMRSVDGVLAQSDLVIDLMKYGLDYSYYSTFLSRIKEVNPFELKELAGRYFVKEEMFEAVAG